MFDALIALGYGIIVFAILIGVGSVVLFNFSAGLASCNIASCGTAGTFNTTTAVCSNASSANCGAATGTAYTDTTYMLTQLGQSGLAGWTPAIIAISVGLLFLGAFLIKGGSKKSGRY